MTPEQSAFLLSVFVAALRKEYPTTLRVLQAVPVDKGDYRPAPNSRSALELVWHLSSADIWFLDGFLAGKFEMEDDTMPADFSNAADIAATYEESMPAKLDKIEKLSPEFWAAPLPFFGIYNLPAVMYLQFMLNHSIHHRGQLTAYLRPMGAKVPNVYGGSFDEPMVEFEE
ncbi:MAG: DinB family protein [Candidatus Acidiferrales bacterium]